MFVMFKSLKSRSWNVVLEIIPDTRWWSCSRKVMLFPSFLPKPFPSFHNPAATQITLKYHTCGLSPYLCLSSNKNSISSQTMQTSPLSLLYPWSRKGKIHYPSLLCLGEIRALPFFCYSSIHYPHFLNNVCWHMDTII